MVESTPAKRVAALNTHNLGVIEAEITPSKWQLLVKEQNLLNKIADFPLYLNPEKEDILHFKHVSLRIIDLFYSDEPRQAYHLLQKLGKYPIPYP